MIGYIKGTLEFIGENFVIIENNGIGYNVFVTANTASRLTKSVGDAKLFIDMNVKEDSISLYGFITKEELEMYRKLISISGVGPKGAISILSALAPSQVSMAIITGDIKMLTVGQGIGKKTAERIILELKDKIKTEDAVATDFGAVAKNDISSQEKTEAIDALVSLGFSRSEAYKTVIDVYADNMDTPDIISLALKKLSK